MFTEIRTDRPRVKLHSTRYVIYLHLFLLFYDLKLLIFDRYLNDLLQWSCGSGNLVSVFTRA